MGEKIISLLKKWLFKKPARYIKLRAKKYLEISGKKAKVVGEKSVPTKERVPSFRGIGNSAGMNRSGGSNALTRGKSPSPGGDVFKRPSGGSRKPRAPYRPKQGTGSKSRKRREKSRRDRRKERNRERHGMPQRGSDRVSPPGQSRTKDGESNEDGRKGKLKELKKLPPEEVARAAATDSEVHQLVMDNPSLVDASNKEEARQKIKIMGGASPRKALSEGPHADIESIGDNYGKSWIAVLGFNEMGDGLADAVNEASGGSDSDGGGSGSSSGSSHTSARGGGRLAGSGSGSVDTGTGSTSISTNSGSAGNSGGAGNGLGSGGGTGSGGGSS